MWTWAAGPAHSSRGARVDGSARCAPPVMSAATCQPTPPRGGQRGRRRRAPAVFAGFGSSGGLAGCHRAGAQLAARAHVVTPAALAARLSDQASTSGPSGTFAGLQHDYMRVISRLLQRAAEPESQVPQARAATQQATSNTGWDVRASSFGMGGGGARAWGGWGEERTRVLGREGCGGIAAVTCKPWGRRGGEAHACFGTWSSSTAYSSATRPSAGPPRPRSVR